MTSIETQAVIAQGVASLQAGNGADTIFSLLELSRIDRDELIEELFIEVDKAAAGSVDVEIPVQSYMLDTASYHKLLHAVLEADENALIAWSNRSSSELVIGLFTLLAALTQAADDLNSEVEIN